MKSDQTIIRKYLMEQINNTTELIGIKDNNITGSFTVELKYFRSMPWYKAIFLSNFFNFILVLFRTLWYNRVG